MLAIVVLISTFQWFFDGCKNFTGPKVEVETSVSEVVPAQPAEAEVQNEIVVGKNEK